MSEYDTYSPECNLSYGNPSAASAYAVACFPGFIYMVIYYTQKRVLYFFTTPVIGMCAILTIVVPYS